MLNRWIARRMATLLGFILVGAVTTSLGGQVAPPKKPPTDTAKKSAVKTEQAKKAHPVSDIHVKVSKSKATAAGEVALPPCPVDQDSVDRAVAAVRAEQAALEQAAIERQRLLDSAQAAIDLRHTLDVMRSEAAATRERERADSIARAEENERQAALARKHHLARGFYVGIGGGMSAPQRDIRNGYTGGWNTTVPLGWDASEAPFGIRTDFSVDHLNGLRLHDISGVTTAAGGDLTVYSINADLKLRAHAPGTPTRSHVYALGGIGAHRVTEGVYGITGPKAGQNLKFADAKTNFGWNVGAGAALEWGPAELFVESRFFHVKSDLGYHLNEGVGTYTSFTPFIVGVHLF